MKPHRSLKKTRCGSWRRAARLRSQMSWPVMSFLSFLSCLVLPCLALPCLAGLATGGSPPFPPCCSSPPRSSRPLDTPIPGAMAHTHVSKQLLNGCVLFPRFSLSRTFGAPSVNVSICSGACASFLGHLGFQQTRSQHFCGVAAVWRPSPGETSKQAGSSFCGSVWCTISDRTTGTRLPIIPSRAFQVDHSHTIVLRTSRITPAQIILPANPLAHAARSLRV
jgi:hypothetical protein